jgi:hypothetical protein
MLLAAGPATEPEMLLGPFWPPAAAAAAGVVEGAAALRGEGVVPTRLRLPLPFCTLPEPGHSTAQHDIAQQGTAWHLFSA